ncbi:MAG: hypothetical protein ACE5KM_03805 [Planctomycetaceae bacterium]
MPQKQQILMGVAVAVLSLVGLWRAGWIVQNTRKGQRLARRFGELNARRIVRVVFALLCLFGTLLAADVIRPVQW